MMHQIFCANCKNQTIKYTSANNIKLNAPLPRKAMGNMAPLRRATMMVDKVKKQKSYSYQLLKSYSSQLHWRFYGSLYDLVRAYSPHEYYIGVGITIGIEQLTV